MGESTFTPLAKLGEFPDADALDILARFAEAEVSGDTAPCRMARCKPVWVDRNDFIADVTA